MVFGLQFLNKGGKNQVRGWTKHFFNFRHLGLVFYFVLSYHPRTTTTKGNSPVTVFLD